MYHWTYELHGTLFIFRRVTTYARLLCDYRSHTTCSYIYTQTWHIWLSTDCMRKYDSMRKPQKIKKIKIYSGSGAGRLVERVKARDLESCICVHTLSILKLCSSEICSISYFNIFQDVSQECLNQVSWIWGKNIEKCNNLTCSLLVLYVRIRWLSLFLTKKKETLTNSVCSGKSLVFSFFLVSPSSSFPL